MRNSRIPVRHPLFVQYLGQNNDYLHIIQPGDTLKRGEVLGLTANELTTLMDFYQSLVSGDPANPGIWDKHSNPDTRTMKTRQDLLEVERNFKVFYRPLLNRMSGSAKITAGDRLILNIANPGTPHKRPVVQIPEKCFTNVTILGGGTVRFECRFNSDSSRTGKPPSAPEIEIAYELDPPLTPTAADSNNKDNKTNRAQLVDPEQATHRYISTKAIFNLPLGAGKAGYTLQYFSRFINSKYPKLAGNWSGLGVIVIS